MFPRHHDIENVNGPTLHCTFKNVSFEYWKLFSSLEWSSPFLTYYSVSPWALTGGTEWNEGAKNEIIFFAVISHNRSRFIMRNETWVGGPILQNFCRASAFTDKSKLHIWAIWRSCTWQNIIAFKSDLTLIDLWPICPLDALQRRPWHRNDL